MSKKLFVYFILFCSFVSAFALENKVVATLSKQVITQRMVYLDMLIEGLLYGTETPILNTLSTDSQRFQEELDRLILERSVYLESQSFNFAQTSKKEIDAVYAQLMEKVRKNKALNSDWKKLDAQSQEVKKIISQKMTSQKFVQFKSKSSKLPVTDIEANEYFQLNKDKFKNKSFSDVKETIKKDLAKTQAESRLNDWYDLLKKKYEFARVF